MNGLIKERCIYCGSEVYYTGTESLIKCSMCGHALVVARFENELAKINAALEEGEKAKSDLQAAEAAEREARARLNEALSALGDIQTSQQREEAAVQDLKGAFDDNAGLQASMMELLTAFHSETAEGQDVIRDLMENLMQGQQEAGMRLEVLRNLSGKLLQAQQDFGARLALQSEIYTSLQAVGSDAKASQDLLQQLMLWFQTDSREEKERLERIASSSAALLQGQKAAADQLAHLRATADQTQETIESFQSQYTQDKLEEVRSLFHQAENFQQDREYDKASDCYRQVIAKGGADAEIWWRLLLCHYCITYRQNDAGEMVPTILYPDLTEPDEMSVRRELEKALAGNVHREVYDEELEKIDAILDEYRLARQEAAYDYDVFLSKETGDGLLSPSRLPRQLHDRLILVWVPSFLNRFETWILTVWTDICSCSAIS